MNYDDVAGRPPAGVTVDVQVLPHAENLPLPGYETEAAAGIDLRAAIDQPIVLQPTERAAIPTGLKLSLPTGYEAQIRPRSGLALKHGISVLNAPGTVDADYRGEIKVIMANLGDQAFTINRGDRIAQMVVSKVARIAWNRVDAVDGTKRGSGGFGSTGVQ